MNVRIESTWQQRLQSEFDKPYFENLTAYTIFALWKIK